MGYRDLLTKAIQAQIKLQLSAMGNKNISHFIVVESSSFRVRKEGGNGSPDNGKTTKTFTDADFYCKVLNAIFDKKNEKDSAYIDIKQFIEPPSISLSLYLGDYDAPKRGGNNYKVVDSIKFNRDPKDKIAYIDGYKIFGIVDRDFGSHIKEEENALDIGITDSHDREMTVFNTYLNEIVLRALKYCKTADEEDAKVSLLANTYNFCFKQGLLEKRSFEVEDLLDETRSRSSAADSRLIGDIIKIVHTYFKDNAYKKLFNDDTFHETSKKLEELKNDQRFSDCSFYIDKLIEKIKQLPLEIKTDDTYKIVNGLINKTLKIDSEQYKEFVELNKLVNGHIFFKQLVKGGFVSEAHCREDDLNKYLNDVIIFNGNNVSLLKNINPIKRYINYKNSFLLNN